MLYSYYDDDDGEQKRGGWPRCVCPVALFAQAVTGTGDLNNKGPSRVRRDRLGRLYWPPSSGQNRCSRMFFRDDALY